MFKGGASSKNYNFEWDSIKAVKNKRKHNVSFEEAAEVFLTITIEYARWKNRRY